MSVMDSIIIGIFIMSVVFVVLIALSALVRVQSMLTGFLEKRKRTMAYMKTDAKSTDGQQIMATSANISSGELVLIGTDEKTAAMIMAIISDRLQVPLGELRFKEIKALDI